MIEEPNGIKCHFRLVPVRVRHPVPLSHYPVAIFTSGRELCLMPAFTNVHGYSGAPTTVFSVPCDRSAGGLAGNRIHPRLRAGFAMGYFSSVTRFSAWQKRKRPGSHMGSGLFWLYLGVQRSTVRPSYRLTSAFHSLKPILTAQILLVRVRHRKLIQSTWCGMPMMLFWDSNTKPMRGASWGP
jgi:hypothetical protein